MVEQKSRSFLYVAVLVACTGGFIFGFASFIISGVIIFLTKEFSLGPRGVGFAVSSMPIGCLIGAGIAGGVSDRLGRRMAMMMGGILWLVSSLGTAMAKNMTELDIFRICGGIGVGMVMLVSPIYIAEISPASLRGRLSTANQFIINGGGLSAFFVSYLISYSGQWRWALAAGLLPALALLIGLFFVPESPRWLIEKGREPEACSILTRINGQVEAIANVNRILASLTGERGSYSDLFHRGTIMALIVGIGIAAFQQLNGAGMVAFYAPVIFQKAGFSNPSTAIGLAVFMFVSNMLCVVIAYGLVDRLGRRPVLLGGTLALGCSLTLLALFLKFSWSPFYALGTVIFIQVIANVSWGPLGWVILGEIFPARIRAKAMSIATFFLWVSMFASVQLFPSMVAYFDRKYGSAAPTFLIFTVICGLAYVFVWWLLPETNGRTLEEISDSWLATKSRFEQ